MCLGELADFEVKKDWGWQCFYNEGRQRYLYGMNNEAMPMLYAKFDEWQKDPSSGSVHNRKKGFSYPLGFHISLSETGALRHRYDERPRKVYFRNIVAKGYSFLPYWKSKYKTIVARERYVCDKTKRPPKD